MSFIEIKIILYVQRLLSIISFVEINRYIFISTESIFCIIFHLIMKLLKVGFETGKINQTSFLRSLEHILL